MMYSVSPSLPIQHLSAFGGFDVGRSMFEVFVLVPHGQKQPSVYGMQGLPLMTSESIFTTGCLSLIIRVFVGG